MTRRAAVNGSQTILARSMHVEEWAVDVVVCTSGHRAALRAGSNRNAEIHSAWKCRLGCRNFEDNGQRNCVQDDKAGQRVHFNNQMTGNWSWYYDFDQSSVFSALP